MRVMNFIDGLFPAALSINELHPDEKRLANSQSFYLGLHVLSMIAITIHAIIDPTYPSYQNNRGLLFLGMVLYTVFLIFSRTKYYSATGKLWLCVITTTIVTAIPDAPDTNTITMLLFYTAIVILLSSLLMNRKWILGFSMASAAIILSTPSMTVHYTYPEAFLILVTNMLVSSIGFATSSLQAKHIAKIQKDKQAISGLLRLVSHDIANPLSVIQGAIYHAKDIGKLEEKSLNKMERSTRMIIKLLANVRDVLAISSGKKIIRLSPVMVSEVIKESLECLEGKITKKAIQIDLNLDETLKVTACKDILVNHILNNLISNAVKFSDKGGIIQIKSYKAPENPKKAWIEIKDCGIGMPKIILANIFRQDKETTRPGTSGEPGTGFGMLIVDSFVKELGGRITLESQERSQGKASGTKVVVELNQP